MRRLSVCFVRPQNDLVSAYFSIDSLSSVCGRTVCLTSRYQRAIMRMCTKIVLTPQESNQDPTPSTRRPRSFLDKVLRPNRLDNWFVNCWYMPESIELAGIGYGTHFYFRCAILSIALSRCRSYFSFLLILFVYVCVCVCCRLCRSIVVGRLFSATSSSTDRLKQVPQLGLNRRRGL